MRLLILIAVRAYRWILSPMKTALLGPGAACRHYPSCSAYAEQAVSAHGAMRGSVLALRRLSRCHPWGTAGFDPVPAAPVRFAASSNPRRSGSPTPWPIGPAKSV
ncbi:MAG: membrane protein insertion efficiency factor YidD [Verrucomicrobiales bacterium]|nr:membrane protein insertion efficiency factor YidD [Verrucomicrobiales bacterium]